MLFLFNSLFYSLIPLFFSLVFLLKWTKWLSNPKTKRNLPPSPSKLPIIGNLHQLGSLPHRSLRSLAQQYGPLMLLHLGSKPALIVSSAVAAREILKTHDLNVASRPKWSIPNRLSYDKDITFSPYGEYWRQVRSICVLHLLSNKRVQSFGEVREEETALMLEKIKQSCSSPSSSPLNLNLTELFISLTNDVVCRVALGKKYFGGEGGSKLKDLFREFMEVLGVFNVVDHIPWLGWLNRVNGLNAKVQKVATELDKFFEDVVEEGMVRQKTKSDDGESDEHDEGQENFLDVLLGIQRQNSTTSFPLHRDSIKALIMDMFAAGTETTYTALEWEMTELLRHPKVMKQLQNEVRGIARGKDITEDDLERMHYLKAVIKESMRLHTPLPLLVPRESIHDIKLMGYDIAAGTQVFINAWAIARDPSRWEDAEEFRPERFLNTSIDYKGQDFQFIPFGGGRRGCPGIQFAATLNELAIAKLVHKFNFTLPNGVRGQDMDLTEAPGISINRKHPLMAVATPYFC